MNRTTRNTIAFAVAAAGAIAIDQISKSVVAATIPLNTGEPVTLIPGVLKVTHLENPGGAFSMFSGNSALVLLLSLAMIVALLVWFWFARRNSPLILLIAVGLMCGGALGNMIDRLASGKVVDFFDLGWWPVFNVADIAIVVGVIIAVVVLFYEVLQERGPETEGPEGS